VSTVPAWILTSVGTMIAAMNHYADASKNLSRRIAKLGTN